MIIIISMDVIITTLAGIALALLILKVWDSFCYGWIGHLIFEKILGRWFK